MGGRTCAVDNCFCRCWGGAIIAAITGTAPYAQAQTTSGTAGIGSTRWTSKSCGGCNAPTAAPINAANVGGHITYAISNSMPTTATPTEANDLAAYLATFLLVPVTANVNQNSGANAIALPQLTLNTAYGKYTGIQVVAAPTRGSVTISGTTATYTPTTDQFGADSFTYHAITAAGCTGSCSSVRTQSINIVVPNPANNAFANRATLTGLTANVTATNAGASKETGEPVHAGNIGGKSVWWKWTAPVTNTVTIKTAGSNFNSLLAVYTGSAVNALTLVIANDDCGASCTPTNTSKVTFTATAGVTYQIAVDGFNAGSGAASGVVILDLFQTPVVPNDNFANATVIPPGNLDASGDNTYATTEAGEPGIAGGGHTLWWRWTAPTTAIYRLATSGSGQYAAAVYTGNSLATLTPASFGTDLAYDMFTGNYFGTATFYATAGSDYRIQIDSMNGVFGFIYFSFDKPGNDNFSAGLRVFGNVFHLVESNVGATIENSEPGLFLTPQDASVWFKWTAPATGPVTIDSCGSAFNSMVRVFTLPTFGGISSLQQVFPSNAPNYCPNPQHGAAQFTAQATTVYFIQLSAINVSPPGIYHLNIVQPQAQVITFPPQNPAVQQYTPGFTFAVNPPASGGASGNPIVYGSSTPGVCTVAGTTVTAASLGTCTLTADQAASTNYMAAATVTQWVNIIVPPVSFTGNAVSRKVHGGVGSFNLPLNAQPINGSIIIEPRSIDAGHVIAFAFSGTVYSLNPPSAVDAMGAPVGSVTAVRAGSEVLVTVAGLADRQRITVSVNGVNGVGGGASASVSLEFLLGDVNGSGAVNAADIAAVKARQGMAVSASNNFLFDLDANGSIDSADVTRVKARSGGVLP